MSIQFSEQIILIQSQSKSKGCAFQITCFATRKPLTVCKSDGSFVLFSINVELRPTASGCLCLCLPAREAENHLPIFQDSPQEEFQLQKDLNLNFKVDLRRFHGFCLANCGRMCYRNQRAKEMGRNGCGKSPCNIDSELGNCIPKCIITADHFSHYWHSSAAFTCTSRQMVWIFRMSSPIRTRKVI